MKDQVNNIGPTHSSWIFHKRVIAIAQTVEPHFLLLYTTHVHYLRKMPRLQCLFIGFVLDALKVIVDQNYLTENLSFVQKCVTWYFISQSSCSN